MKLSKKIILITTAILLSLGVSVAGITLTRNRDKDTSSSTESETESSVEQTSETSETIETEESSSTSEVSASSESVSASEEQEVEVEAPPEPSAAVLGENIAEIPEKYADVGIEFTFTAINTATHVIETADENCFISWTSNDHSKHGKANVDSASIFELEVGETITIKVSTKNHQADIVAFTIEQEEICQPFTLKEGTNTLQIAKADGLNQVEYTFTADADGNYLLSSQTAQSPTNGTNEETVTCAISYVINDETKWVSDTQTLFSVQAGETITFTAYVYDESLYLDGVFALDLTITPVVLADEQATVVFIDGQAVLSFYPTETGTYTFTLTEGAQVLLFDPLSWGYVAVSYITINEPDSIFYVLIQSDTLTEATIILTKA